MNSRRPPGAGPPPASASAEKHLRVACAACAAVALLVIYGPLVVADPVLARDDKAIVAGLSSVHSFADYAAALRDGRVPDRLPVRDLSLWIDAKIGTFHATNLLVWVLVALALHSLLLLYGTSPALAAVVALAFAVHPVFVGSVAWISARKHLLAALFTLLATVRLERKRLVSSVACYALAVASQPIALLWPIVAALRNRRVAIACAPIALAAAWVNYTYYRGAYTALGAQKFVEGTGLGDSLLAVGRAFANIALPLRLAAAYDPGSWLGLFGLVLLPIWVWGLIRAGGAIWALWFFFPLAVVTARMTNVFLSDTYLLLPAAGVFAGAAHLLARVRPRIALASAAGVAVLGAALSAPLARTWSSDARVWEHACATERAPDACAHWASILTSSGRAADGMAVALEADTRNPGHAHVAQALAAAVYENRALTADQKLAVLDAHRSDDAWWRYYTGVLLAGRGQMEAGASQLRLALRTPERFGREVSVVAAEASWMCRRAGAPDCDSLPAPLRLLHAWDERRYAARLAVLH